MDSDITCAIKGHDGRRAVLLLLSMVSAASLAGCTVDSCTYQTTLRWYSPELGAASADSHAFDAIVIHHSLRPGDTDRFRLFQVVEERPETTVRAVALEFGPAIVASGNPSLVAGAVEDFLILMGFNQSEAKEYVADGVEPNQAIPLKRPIALVLEASDVLEPNGFWKTSFQGTLRVDRALPHHEYVREGEHLAVAGDGAAAWWNAEGPRLTLEEARAKVGQMLSEIELGVPVAANATVQSEPVSCP